MGIAMFFSIDDPEQFEKWLRRVAAQEPCYKHLLEDGYEDERAAFYDNYFKKGFSPWKALQHEYLQYG